MNKIDLNAEMKSIGLSEKDYSTKLTNPYAYFQLRLGLGLVWEVYYRDERSGAKYHKREFKNEEDAKKYLVDLARITSGKRTIYNVISQEEDFNDEKRNLLNEINVLLLKSNKEEKTMKVIDLLSKFKMHDALKEAKEDLLNESFFLGRTLSDKIFFFVHSISIPDSANL